MILTFQTSFPTVDEEERFSDINVPETRTVDDLFKVVSAETGVSLTSPMEIVINDVKFTRNDKRTLLDAGINEYDMVEVKILKNGGRPIPGNITIGDLYSALGERLKKMKMDMSEPVKVNLPLEVPKNESVEEKKVEAPVVSAPAVKAPTATNAFAVKPAATNAFAVKAPAATNAFAVKSATTNAFAVKPATTNAFTVKPANAFAIKTPTKSEEKPEEKPVEEKSEEKPTDPQPAPQKPTFAVKTNTFAIKTGVNKFSIKK